MRDKESNRLASPDPWTDVEAARLQRGALVVAAWRRWRRGWRGAGPAVWRRPGPGGRGAGPAGVMALLPLAAAYVLSYLFRNVNGVLAPDIMRDLGVGADALGLLTSVLLLVFAAAQVPIGIMLDRFGPGRVQVVLLLCAAAGSALSAADSGFAGLLIGRGLIGLGTAGSLVAGLKAAAAWYPRERLARVNSALVMCGGLGALLATWPAEFALRSMGWRGVSALLAGLALACALAVRLLVPAPRPGVAAPAVQASLREIVRDPLFRRFAPLSAACFGTVLAVQGLWAGLWLADVDGLSRGDVASGLACMAAVLVVAAPCWGLATQWLRRRIKLSHAAAGAAMLMVGAELLLLGHPGMPSLLPWCVFAVFGGFTVLSFSILGEHFPPAVIGRANGALNVLHIGMSFLIQFGIGEVVARWAPLGGHYPVEAYRAGLLLPIGVQVAALAWFAWPRRIREALVAP